MLRFLYAFLIRLHPRRFRERFADEMLAIFEEASGTMGSVRLLGDGLWSLVRQWTFRPQREPVPASVANPSGMFQTLDDYKPRRFALLQGGALSAILFWVLVVAATNGARPLKFLIGSTDPRSGVLSVTRSSIEPAAPDATVRVPPPAADPWLDFASRYFKIIYVLDVLDANHDYVISASEIAAAPAALRKLDRNGDGALTAEECGMRAISGTQDLERLRTVFMGANPVLAALDSDHDAVISASEIESAAAALKRLDLNGDGKLLPVEVAPESIARKILMNKK
jgi:hypothetical protein